MDGSSSDSASLGPSCRTTSTYSARSPEERSCRRDRLRYRSADEVGTARRVRRIASRGGSGADDEEERKCACCEVGHG